MYYLAEIQAMDDTYLVNFPDLDSINTYGNTFAEAIQHASEALNGCLEADIARGLLPPAPSRQEGDNLQRIYVSPAIELAYYLRKWRGHRGVEEIAKRLHVSSQVYQQLENPQTCNPTLNLLEQIANLFGKRLEVIME
jgi:predicted RNase H-like HicB family nuclease/DNA-binding XRE family transcriptional regulator